MALKAYGLANGDRIPDTRLLKIYKHGDGTILATLFVDDEVSIKASSKFGQLWEAQPSNIMNLLSGSFGFPSGQFALQGAQVWQSTEPLSFNITGHLYADKSAYEDVILTTKVLMSCVLPTYSGGNKMLCEANEFLESKMNLQLKTLIPPGPNIQTLLNAMSANGSSSQVKGTYDIKIGCFTFTNVIMTSVQPTFSKMPTIASYKSRTSIPCPIKADIDLEFVTMEVATTDMINGIA